MTSEEPESLTEAERYEKSRFSNDAREMLGVARDHGGDPSIVAENVATFIDKVQTAAADEQLKMSNGTVLSDGDMIHQYRGFIDSYRKPSDTDPFRYIVSAGGLRDAFKALMSDEVNGAALMAELEGRIAARSEQLRTEDKIDEVGEVASEAAGVIDPAVEQQRQERVKRLHDKRFVMTADSIVEHAADQKQAPDDIQAAIKGLLQNVLSEAQNGTVVSSSDKTPYSMQDILGRLKAYGTSANTDPTSIKKEALLIPSDGGLRRAIVGLTSGSELRGAYLKALAQIDAEQVKPETPGVEAARRLTDLDSAERQKDPYDYLRKVLPPVVRPPREETDYDKLLFGDDKDTPWRQNVQSSRPEKSDEDRQREYYDRYVTPENREASRVFMGEVVKATPGIAEILSKHGLAADSLDAVDAIREDPEVRFEVAKLLTQKLDTLANDPHTDMGWRVVRNPADNLKVDPVTAKRMTSRNYAVSMALKMIGGEFSKRHEGSDPIERDKSGAVAIGQHRHAAVSTLMSYGVQ